MSVRYNDKSPNNLLQAKADITPALSLKTLFQKEWTTLSGAFLDVFVGSILPFLPVFASHM